MPPLDHVTLARALMPAVLEAGATLLRYRAQGVEVERKADDSPVTAADRRAEAIVLAALAEAAPGVPVIAEEQVAIGRVPAYGRQAFLVDALDGTREFVAGGDDFTVNVALVEDGVPTFGIVLAPAAGRLFATFAPRRAVETRVAPDMMSDRRAALEFRDIATTEPDLGALRVLASRSHPAPGTTAFLQKLKVGRMRGVGSSLKFGLVAAGEADIYPRFGPTSAWDTAAGHAVLTAAGGTVTTAQGTPLTYLGTPGGFLNPPFIAWGRAHMIHTCL